MGTPDLTFDLNLPPQGLILNPTSALEAPLSDSTFILTSTPHPTAARDLQDCALLTPALLSFGYCWRRGLQWNHSAWSCVPRDPFTCGLISFPAMCLPHPQLTSSLDSQSGERPDLSSPGQVHGDCLPQTASETGRGC